MDTHGNILRKVSSGKVDRVSEGEGGREGRGGKERRRREGGRGEGVGERERKRAKRSGMEGGVWGEGSNCFFLF